MTFVQKLNEILEKKHITAYKMCKDIGIGKTSINNWEKGSAPNLETFKKIVLYLEISADELLEINRKAKELTEQEQELLTYFRALGPADQARELGRLEGKAEANADKIRKTEQERLLSSRTG